MENKNLVELIWMTWILFGQSPCSKDRLENLKLMVIETWKSSRSKVAWVEFISPKQKLTTVMSNRNDTQVTPVSRKIMSNRVKNMYHKFTTDIDNWSIKQSKNLNSKQTLSIKQNLNSKWTLTIKQSKNETSDQRKQ